MRPSRGGVRVRVRVIVFTFVCLILVALVLESAAAPSTSSSDAKSASGKKDYGIRSAIGKRVRRLMKPRPEVSTKSATSSSAVALSRQDEYPEFSDYGIYERDPNPNPNSLQSLSHKDDQVERVGIITGKKILKIIGISLLGLLIIPGILLIPLLPCVIILLILYNLPIVKLIDVPPMDPNDGNDNNNGNRRAMVAMGRNLLEFDDSCIERISCSLGKRSGSYGKLVMHWLQRRFTQFTSNSLVQRISRGFEHPNDCETHVCSNSLVKRIL